jgi:hypothetical protein
MNRATVLGLFILINLCMTVLIVLTLTGSAPSLNFRASATPPGRIDIVSRIHQVDEPDVFQIFEEVIEGPRWENADLKTWKNSANWNNYSKIEKPLVESKEALYCLNRMNYMTDLKESYKLDDHGFPAVTDRFF